MYHRSLPVDTTKQIIARKMIKRNYSREQIAEHLNVTVSRISELLNTPKVLDPKWIAKNDSTKALVIKVKQMREQGIKVADIAKDIQRSKARVYELLKN